MRRCRRVEAEVSTFVVGNAPPIDPPAYGAWLHCWLADHRARLADEIDAAERGDVRAELRLLRALADAGATQVGWPPRVGGVGGGPVHRAVFYDALVTAGYPIPHVSYVFDTVAPALLEFGDNSHGDRVAAHLRGEEIWCQGFSEPEAGSDLGAVRLRATPEDGGWRLNGEKLWVSLGHVADWCLLLARTGTTEERHRGLTMFFVPMERSAIRASPLRLLTGRDELASLSVSDGYADPDAVVGEVGAGWAVAMFLLQWERGMYAWQRACWLGARLRELRTTAAAAHDGELGSLATRLAAVRSRALETVLRLHRGEVVGPAASIDKVVLTEVEQRLFDLARRVFDLDVTGTGDPRGERWRADYFYSRMASVYGGALEVQLDTVAKHIVGLPAARRMDR